MNCVNLENHLASGSIDYKLRLAIFGDVQGGETLKDAPS